LRHHLQVASWYRFNVFLFVHSASISQLPPFVRLFEIDVGENVADVAPLPYRLRKSLIRVLPFWAKQWLAEAIEIARPLSNRSS
jgi:hypothetical protein